MPNSEMYLTAFGVCIIQNYTLTARKPVLNHKYALIAEQEVRIVQCGVRISVSTLWNTIYDGLHNDHEIEMELDAESSRLPSGYGCGEEEEVNQGTSAAKTVEQRRIPGASKESKG